MAIERVKNHFEDEAKEFDAIIQRLIPNYNEMIAALVSVVPFSKESIFSMIDLGCGTGTVSKAVKNGFPNAEITCVDIAGPMLDIAREKIYIITTLYTARRKQKGLIGIKRLIINSCRWLLW